MKTDKNKDKEENIQENIINQNQLLLCPDCRIQIPLISFIKSKGGIDLTYKCLCSSEVKKIKLEYYFALLKKNQKQTYMPQCLFIPEHFDQKAEVFCFNCSKWLCNECSATHNSSYNNHKLINHELIFKCVRHYSNYSYYCHTCQMSLCKQCLSDFSHQNHQLEEIWLINPLAFVNQSQEIDKTSQAICQIKTEFIQYIDNQIKEYTRWKENIEIAYETNKRINYQLKELIRLIHSTLDFINNIPNYPMIHIINSINITKSNEFKLDYKNIKECYYKLLAYLRENFILAFVPQKTYQCLATLKGHEDWVSCILELKDGTISSSSRDNTIRLWDFNDLKCKSILTGHKDWVNSLIELNNGCLMSCSADQTIKMWNLSTLECVNTFRGHKEVVSTLIKLQDGRIASGSWDTTIKIWNLESMVCVSTLEKNSQMVMSLIQLQNGYLCSGSFNNIIEIWDINSKKCLITLTEHNVGIWSLLQLSNGILLSGARNGILKIWSNTSMKCIGTIEAHQDCIYCLILLNEDGFFASGSGDQTIKIWDSSTFRTTTIIEGDIKFVSSFVLTITNNLLLQGVISLTQLRNGYIASGSSEHTIKIWDI